jgi:hypothetical protein
VENQHVRTAAESVIPDFLNSFSLETPIVRGDQSIKRVTLRKPNTEALRGTQLAPLSQMDVDQLCKLLPRISSPSLTEAEVAHMEAADIVKAGIIVIGFLFPTQAKELQSLNV